ncbi:hypothetical protein M8C21_016288, partial [Ambrosia artemisiifolia]
KNSKRRWVFKKTSVPETTTILHRHESNDISTTKITSAMSQDDEKHTAATTVAVTIIPSYSFEKHNAALIIQTSFRGYLALVRVQARVCDQRRKLSTFPDSASKSIIIEDSKMQDLRVMLQKTQVAPQKDAFINQINPDPIELVKIDACQHCSLSPQCERSQNHYQQQRLDSNTFSFSQQQSPSSISRVKNLVKAHSTSPRSERVARTGKPSYMSTTASAMARIRPQSSPMHRMSITTEGEEQKSTRRRLSFDLYMNGGGVSDNELDRTPIRMTERRLSVSSCRKQRVEDEISRHSVSEERKLFR